jgi:hypothetical protein
MSNIRSSCCVLWKTRVGLGAGRPSARTLGPHRVRLRAPDVRRTGAAPAGARDRLLRLRQPTHARGRRRDPSGFRSGRHTAGPGARLTNALGKSRGTRRCHCPYTPRFITSAGCPSDAPRETGEGNWRSEACLSHRRNHSPSRMNSGTCSCTSSRYASRRNSSNEPSSESARSSKN